MSLPRQEDTTASALPLPRLRPEQDELLRVAFHELRRTGRAVPVPVLSGRCGLAPRDVTIELDRLVAAGRVGRRPDGCVTGALGLTVETTRHELLLDGARWNTWCVIDALGILGALRETGAVRSPAPGTGSVVEVRFREGSICGGDLGCVVYVPEYRDGASVLGTWCPSVNFFPDAASARAWAVAHSVPGRPVALATAAVGAARRWRDRLTPSG